MTSDYGKRTCLECGKEFNATYLQQITCSPLCLAKRKAKLRIIRDQRRHQCHKERLATLIAENNKLLSDNEALRHDLLLAQEEAAHAKEELAKALKAAAAPKKSGKYAKDGPSFCPRLSMVGPGLPCGEKPECYKQSVCKHVPDGATVPAA